MCLSLIVCAYVDLFMLVGACVCPCVHIVVCSCVYELCVLVWLRVCFCLGVCLFLCACMSPCM